MSASSSGGADFRASELGAKLFGGLFTGPLLELFAESRQAAETAQRTWRLCLRFQADKLARVPWEVLYQERAGGSFLAQASPIVRVPATGRAPRAPRPAKPRRILWVGASPNDLPTLDIDHERKCLEEALQTVGDAERPQVTTLKQARLDDVLRELRTNSYQVLHFAG